MTYHRVDAGLARLFSLGLEAELPKKVDDWKEHLAVGRMSDEMRRVFFGLGWLSSLHDPRIRDTVDDETPTADPPPVLHLDTDATADPDIHRPNETSRRARGSA